VPSWAPSAFGGSSYEERPLALAVTLTVLFLAALHPGVALPRPCGPLAALKARLGVE
jgi:hypothetical protein